MAGLYKIEKIPNAVWEIYQELIRVTFYIYQSLDYILKIVYNKIKATANKPDGRNLDLKFLS